MKKTTIIAITLLTMGCQQSSTLDKPMTTAWAKYEPETTNEPNYHIMLKSKAKDFCMISLTKASIDQGKEMQASTPGEAEADMDCYYNGLHYVLDQSDSTNLRVVPSNNPDINLAVFANLNSIENGDTLSISIIAQAE